MEPLLDLIVRELERARDLPAQVIRHLNTTYGTPREELGTFLETELGRLEDYEVDLILSPAFTPTLDDQALVASLLRGRSIPAEEIGAIVRRVVARPTVAHLAAEDGVGHPVPLREVTVERYVRRLRLEGAVSPALVQAIEGRFAAADQAVALAVARRAIWTPPARQSLLEHYLISDDEGRTSDEGRVVADLGVEDLLVLLRLAETYEPAGLPDFRDRFTGWLDAVRREAGAALQPRPFFNNRVEDLHGGGRDQRRPVDPKSARREAELHSMLRLQAGL
jgi:hypothetical protein